MFRPMVAATFFLLLWIASNGNSVKRNRGRSSSWWGIAHSDQPSNLVLDSHHNAAPGNKSPDLNVPLRKKQRKLVRENTGVLAAIAKGIRMAVAECKFQFKDRRWNCPTSDYMRGKSLFGKIVQRGCRESSFLYAITSAGVTHAVSRACSEGTIQTCTCDYRSRGPSSPGWEWGGCSDSIDFGYKFSQKFVDAAEKGRDLRFVINMHNNEAGRLHVSTGMRMECKCHGMSGSCTVKTCWMRLPYFRDVGNDLKDRFDGASRVLVSNQGNFRRSKRKQRFQMKPYNPDHKVPSPKDLVYVENSPDFCSANHKLGVHGTQGRMCNDTSLGLDGCELMCCGRGYKTETREDIERCNCTFHWCCQVECKICKIKRIVHTCL